MFLSLFTVPLLIAIQFATILVVVPLLASRGRGVPKTVYRPRLGWVLLGSYLVLCLIMAVSLIGIGPLDDEAREDLPQTLLVISLIIGLPWSFVPGFIINTISRNASAQPYQLWVGLIELAGILSFIGNCWIAYQVGKRLPVLRAPRPSPPLPPLLADLLSRPTFRRRLLISGIVALVGVGGLYIYRPLSKDEMIARNDEQLIASFRANRPAFEQLVQMYIADDRDELIDVDGSYRLRPAYPAPDGPGYPVPERLDRMGKPIPSAVPQYTADYPAPVKQVEIKTQAGVDESRRMEYVALLKRVALTSIWPGTLNQGLFDGTGFTRDYPGPHRIVRLVVSDKSMFIYSQTPLRLAASQFVAPAPESTPLAEGVSAVDTIEVHCRRFEAQWYVCERVVYNG